MLAANVWTDARGSAAVGFTDRAIRVVARGEETWKAYAVEASAKGAESGDDHDSTITTLCMGTADWTDIATLTVPRVGDAGAYATFQCPSVCGGAELSLSPTLKRVGLDGPNDVLAAHGTSREAAESSIAEWCALWRPTATAAAWTKVVDQDYGDDRPRSTLDHMSPVEFRLAGLSL